MFKKIFRVALALLLASVAFLATPPQHVSATTLEVAVSASTDDTTYWKGPVNWAPATTSSDVGYYGGYALGAAQRYNNITIPQGATITAAYIIFISSGNYAADSVKADIRCEQADNAATFSTQANFDTRSFTGTSFNWDNVPHWTTSGTYNTVDFTTAVQEVISRANWVSGNSIVVLEEDWDRESSQGVNTFRDFWDWDGASHTLPSKIHIEYSANAAPTVTTQAVDLIKDVTARGNGSITGAGTPAATKRGVCWNTTGSPTVADSKTEESPGPFGTGAYTEAMAGLIKNTLYYVKAYAYNTVGYAYGSQVTFTTYDPEQSSSALGLIYMGIIKSNTSYSTGLTAFQIQNTGNCAVDVLIQGSDMTGGTTWTLSDTASPGTDIYGLKAGLSGADYTITVPKTSTGTLKSALGIGSTQQFGLKFYTPLVNTDAVQKSGTVTLSVVMN